MTTSQSNIQELSLAAENVLVSGYFRVGIEVGHAGPPSVTNDTDGMSSLVNNLLRENTEGWSYAALFGVSGDWIIRAVVSDGGGPMIDAGVIDASPGVDAANGGPDAAMGGSCDGNGDCDIGEYCDLEVRSCTFDCRASSDCPADGECNSLGQCVGGDSEAGGGCCSTGHGGGAAGAMALAGLVGLVVTWRRRKGGAPAASRG